MPMRALQNTRSQQPPPLTYRLVREGKQSSPGLSWSLGTAGKEHDPDPGLPAGRGLHAVPLPALLGKLMPGSRFALLRTCFPPAKEKKGLRLPNILQDLPEAAAAFSAV